MSVRGLQTLLIIALTDRTHAEALLRGAATAYEGFDLSVSEIQRLKRIQAESLTEYARQAHLLLYAEDLSLEEAACGAPGVPQAAASPPAQRERSCA